MARETLMATSSGAVVETLLESFAQSNRNPAPYPHWFLSQCLPQATADEITELPFPGPELGGISGKREVHNATRKYFDAENKAKHAVCNAFCDAFQDKRVTDAIQKYVRDEALGLLSSRRIRTGYRWLLARAAYGSRREGVHDAALPVEGREPRDLGTDIYDAGKKPIGRSPFEPNGAMVFVPSNVTYHGFEPRRIESVRKSVIINYVTNEWRAREQLSFPDRPIA